MPELTICGESGIHTPPRGEELRVGVLASPEVKRLSHIRNVLPRVSREKLRKSATPQRNATATVTALRGGGAT